MQGKQDIYTRMNGLMPELKLIRWNYLKWNLQNAGEEINEM
jgi:hypothetical protein